MIHADVGDTELIICKTFGNGVWYFQTERRNPKGSPIFFGNTILLSDIELNQAGFYYCYGSYQYLSKHFLANAELRVYGEFFSPDNCHF